MKLTIEVEVTFVGEYFRVFMASNENRCREIKEINCPDGDIV